jgi:FtsH-binding integral membrane protein
MVDQPKTGEPTPSQTKASAAPSRTTPSEYPSSDVGWFFAFIIVPAGFAYGGYCIGAELIGQPVLGWVMGAAGLVMALAIGRYLQAGATMALILGGAGVVVGGVIGAPIGLLFGTDTPMWAVSAMIGAGVGLVLGLLTGFLIGAIGTLRRDFSQVRARSPSIQTTGLQQPRAPEGCNGKDQNETPAEPDAAPDRGGT